MCEKVTIQGVGLLLFLGVTVSGLACAVDPEPVAEAYGESNVPAVNDYVVDEDRLNSEQQDSSPKALNVVAVGHDLCYLVQAYFPKDALNKLLPRNFAIPDDSVMAEYYPDTELKNDSHPFLMNFCHGSKIHDIFSKIDFPEQEELLFMFPIIYTHENGGEHLCSYVPVLYLDSFAGVAGGLLFGLRKEFHANMKHGETDITNWWGIDGIINASFVKHPDHELEEFPAFAERTYRNPMVTISYPLPDPKMMVYNIEASPTVLMEASESFFWNYKGATVKDSDDTWSVFSEFDFTMTQPMSGRRYFK